MASTDLSHVGSSQRREVASGQAPVGMDLRKITTPILAHMLRGKIRFPSLFLLKCKLTVGPFKRSIDAKFPQDLIDLAALPLWVYINMKKKIGQRSEVSLRQNSLRAGLAVSVVSHPVAHPEAPLVEQVATTVSGFDLAADRVASIPTADLGGRR
jgi:hypothetical protein